MLLNNNELWDDLDFWYGYKKELTRFDYGSRNMSNETLKRLEENPIINFDIFFILEPYFIDWSARQKYLFDYFFSYNFVFFIYFYFH